MTKRTKWALWLLATALAMALVAAGLAMWARQRLAQVESGVCEEAGRALTKEELRRAVLQSLVDYRIGNANRWCGITRSCVIRVSINRNPEETDIIKLIERAVQSDTRTFEENFALEEIAPIDIYPRKDPFDISALKEPFTLASYGKERYQDKPGSGTVSFHVSTDVQEAHFNGQLSLYRRLLGYGNHYFYVPYTLFGNRCCDKGVPRKEREKSYAFISGSIAEKSKLPKEVVPVSNCGGLLTEREQDTGMHLHQLVYLKEN